MNFYSWSSICGVIQSDGKVTGYSPYFDVGDSVSADEIEIVN